MDGCFCNIQRNCLTRKMECWERWPVLLFKALSTLLSLLGFAVDVTNTRLIICSSNIISHLPNWQAGPSLPSSAGAICSSVGSVCLNMVPKLVYGNVPYIQPDQCYHSLEKLPLVAKNFMAFDLLLVSFVAQTLTNKAYFKWANIIGILA